MAKALWEKGFFYIFLGNTMNKLIAFISSMAIVRLIDKKEYACLTYSDNIYSYITLLSGLGMASALLKYCSSDNDEKNKAYIFFSIKWGSIFQIFLVLCLGLCLPFLEFPFDGARQLIYIFILYPLLEYWFNVLVTAVRSSFANKQYAIISFIQVFTVLCLGVVFTVLIGVQGVLVARYIAIAIAGGSAFAFLKQKYKNVKQIRLKYSEKKVFLGMAISLLVANLFSMVMPLNELSLINNLIRDEIITANYKVATMIPAQLPFITSSVIMFFFPILARMQNRKEVWKLSVKVGIILTAVIFLIVVIGLICSKYIIFLIYGKEYMDAVFMARVFWIVYFFNAAFRMLPMNILPALGVAKFNAIVSIVSCVFHYLIDYFFIKQQGIYGVAFATSIVYLLSGIVYWFFLYKVCKKEVELEEI